MTSLDLAVIGNCSYGALIDKQGRIVWCCLPYFDRDPTFCALLGGDEAKDGVFEIELLNLERSEQFYWRNSAVVETRLYDKEGGAVAIIDFAPRFHQFGRTFRPTQIVRRLRPLAGTPRLKVRVRPRYNYGAGKPEVTRGSNHIRYVTPSQAFRLTCDSPISCVAEEVPFVLRGPMEFVFGPDETIPQGLSDLGREFLERTDAYWRDWCRRLSLPFEWQDEVIRAAITLKLMSFEDTGAIIAALTTSVPESADSGRNWDYRYCWLRDSWFVVDALNSLNATGTMEGYLDYIVNIVADSKEGYLQPAYSIMRETKLPEFEVESLAGYRGMGPVRVGNAAVIQLQNDGYGSVILAATPMFFDRRLPVPGDEGLFRLLEKMAGKCAELALEPDAGIWEFRGRKRVHTHSGAMCWAGLSRTAAIAARIGLNDRAAYWHDLSDRVGESLLSKVWNEKRRAFTAAEGTEDMDASVLLLPELGLIDARDPRFASTVAAIEQDLVRGRHVMRYAAEDDFGLPETEFLVCRFWLIDALAALGRREEARERYTDALALRNSYGLLAEDIHPQTGALWGNFPQTYSMAGVILSAMRLSQSWEDRYWRASS